MLGHQQGGVSVVDVGSKKATNYRHKDGLPNDDVVSMYALDSCNVLVGTKKGLTLFNPHKSTFTQISPQQLGGVAILNITSCDRCKYLISTEFHGVYILNLDLSKPNETTLQRPIDKGGTLSSGGTFNQLTSRAALQDSFGNTWIGVWETGLVFLDWNSFAFSNITKFPGSHDHFSVDWRSATCVVSNNGNLWVGTDGGGIHQYEGTILKRSYVNIGGHKESMHPLAALCDKNGKLWFGAFNGGLYTINPTNEKARYIPTNSAFMPDIRGLALIDNILLCLASDAIYAVNTSSEQYIGKYDIANARTIARDNKGLYWVGLYGGGINIYDIYGNIVKKLETISGFSSNSVQQIIISPTNDIYCATGDGLVKFVGGDVDKMKVLTTADGLPNNFIAALTFDKRGRLWGSTYSGIFCIANNHITAFTNIVGVVDGCFFASSVDLSEEGIISFGSLEGLCRFNPDLMLDDKESPRPIISNFTAFGANNSLVDMTCMGEVNTDKTYTLPYNINSLQFTASIPNYANARGMQYQFYLTGLDNDWVNSRYNSIIYRNVPPGNYKLMVRSCFHNQKWNTDIVTLNIRIKPPFWWSWWAIIIYCLLGLGIAILIMRMVYAKMFAEARYRLEKRMRVTEHEKNDERMTFYTNISHELRTPLTLIKGPIDDALASDTLSQRDRERLNIVSANANNLSELVDKILDFRKCETKNRHLYIRPINIVSLLYNIALNWKDSLPNERIKLVTDIVDENITVQIDREAFSTIISNLLSNAIKYTQRGIIAITCIKEDDKVSVKVSDTGIGIAPEHLQHIFEPYYREPNQHQVTGTGIGLALVKQLADLMNIHINVVSTPNKGSIFTLEIPLPTTIVAPKAEEILKETDIETRHRPLILLVEDNVDLQHYIKDIFQDLYDVNVASNGQQGLEKTKSIMPDIVISDVMMPVMDGITMCRTLTNDITTSHIPVVLLTAKSLEADRQEGYSAGAHSYITKPFSSQLLLQRIENILNERRRLAKYLSQTADKSSTKSTTTTLKPLDQEFIDKLDKAIDDNIEKECVDSSYLCDILCMSRVTLYRKVKALTSLSPNEYVRRRRMYAAMQLLKTERYTITEISYKVGFNSPSYFRKCFKEEFGYLPSNYNLKE